MPTLPRLPTLVLLAILITLPIAAAAADGDAAEGWTSLFNGRDFTGWDRYLGPRYDALTKKFDGPPVGANNDPDGVFSVVNIDGLPAIRISGAVWGSLTSKNEYENYHLRLQFRWGELRHAPRADSPRDSGLLYHSTGPDAIGWFFWKRSQEFQVQEHDVGDYWAIGGTSIQSHVRTEIVGDKPTYIFSLAGELTTFRSGAPAGGRIRRSFDAELPRGQWNTLDLYCLGSASLHVVNNAVVMVLRKSEQPDGDEGYTPLTKGSIQLQSEGAEVYYRAIAIKPINQLPELLVDTRGL